MEKKVNLFTRRFSLTHTPSPPLETMSAGPVFLQYESNSEWWASVTLCLWSGFLWTPSPRSLNSLFFLNRFDEELIVWVEADTVWPTAYRAQSKREKDTGCPAGMVVPCCFTDRRRWCKIYCVSRTHKNLTWTIWFMSTLIAEIVGEINICVYFWHITEV